MKTRIKEMRLEKGLTQTDLALKLGLTRNTIAYYENEDKTPTVEILSKIADLFQCSIDYLVFRNDDNRGIKNILVYDENSIEKGSTNDYFPLRQRIIIEKKLNYDLLFFYYINNDDSKRLIKKNDYALFIKENNIRNNDIVLISLNNEKPKIALYNIEDNKIKLRWFDETFTEKTYLKEENNFTIYGKYIGKFEIN